MSISEPMARRIFQKAINTGQSGALLDCLFEGGTATIDGSTGELVMIPGAALAEFAEQETPEWCTCRAGIADPPGATDR